MIQKNVWIRDMKNKITIKQKFNFFFDVSDK